MKKKSPEGIVEKEYFIMVLVMNEISSLIVNSSLSCCELCGWMTIKDVSKLGKYDNCISVLVTNRQVQPIRARASGENVKCEYGLLLSLK